MKKALIVGINNYPQSPLRGCVNDANDWNSTLRDKGFTNSVLLDSVATKSNILSGLNWLVSGAVSGDSLVFCYSGHGSKVRDTNGDEADLYDEILCPVDFFSGQYVSDDNLRSIFSALPIGVSLDVFIDSCYSGTATRSANLKPNKFTFRCIPGPITNGALSQKVVTLVLNLNHCLWAGCKDNQTSAEGVVGGVYRGLFTYYAARKIRAGGIRSDLISSIQSSVTSKNPSQTPQLECTQAESLHQPFL
ncbi:MAG: caspase family protein [Proteobacteria bacterium]|jgi:hypothetical protein|nr:caspase family protein [Pseudomonadota bacterium]